MIFQYDFMQRALLSGIFIGISCSLLGVFLVLKRLSLIGHGLGHISFTSVAVAMLVGVSPLYISIPIVMIMSLFILYLAQNRGFDNDSSIGLLSSAAIAAGVIIASISDGFNVDILSYLFGSILTVRQSEMILSLILSLAVILTVILVYRKLFLITYDEEFARALGIRAEWYNKLLVLLTSINVVLSIRVVGTMLVSSLIIIPALTAIQVKRSFTATLLLSVTAALISVISGICISYYYVLHDGRSLPTGATIVMVNLFLFLLSFIYSQWQR
ncbi:metal ABC transporter permease [Chitinivibrio alkaliphilus]|uniref:Mn2+/Zn2+ ABC transporter permease n=1 Tax=Chitinivibrio alkaliphilus ACht1 TaxID=1313304 RepID=U7D8U2_9BACT|nr:metal ABC transporter permease [Chitinivibrio alkaliphilus]ERP39360.1 Mn2+/Zn2+ ABC transporter permease [Chitinivibrio alkaliphilus ACht1]